MARTSLQLQGIVLPDSRISTDYLSTADSTYTQADPTAAGAVALPSGAVVALSGEQAASLVVDMTRGGPPDAARGARIGWRPSTETALRGWSPPTWCWGYTTSAAINSEAIDAIALKSGEMLMVVGSSGDADTRAVRWDPVTDVWDIAGSTGYESVSASLSTDGLIALWQNPDTGRVHCLQTDREGADPRYILLYSDDDGETWTLQAEVAFTGADPVHGWITRWWRLETGEHVLVVIGEETIQTFSSLNAELWQLVGQIAAIDETTAGAPLADVQMLPSGSLLYSYVLGADGSIAYSMTIAPLQDPSTGVAVEVEDYAATIAQLMLFVEETGRVWLFLEASNQLEAWRSIDDGATWLAQGARYVDENAGMCGSGGRKAVALQGGWAWLKTSHSALTPYVLPMGGWNSWEPWAVGDVRQASDPTRITWGCSDTTAVKWSGATITSRGGASGDWGLTLAGGATATASDAGYTVVTAGGADTATFERTGATGDSAIFLADLYVVSGGNLASNDIAMRVRLDLGAADIGIDVRFTTTGFRVIDAAGGGTLATVTTSCTIPIQVLVCVESGNRVEVYYRRPFAATWTSAYQAAGGLSTVASTGAYARFGHLAVATAESVWRFAGHVGSTSTASGTAARDQWRCSQSTDSARVSFLGRPLAGYPGALGDPALWPSAALVGVSSASDSATAPPRYPYPISAIDPSISPSPRLGWRSSGLNEQIIAWELDDTHDQNELRGLVLYVDGANFRTAYLEAYIGGAWTELAELDLRKVSGFTNVRNGVTVRTSSTSLAWVQQGEAVGGSVVFASGDVRRIVQNDAGQGDKSWTLSLDPDQVDGTESTGGNADLWLPRGAVISFNRQVYRRLRLRIPSQTIADAYYELGLAFIGRLYSFGVPWDYGTDQSISADVEEVAMPGYTLRARRAPPARRWQIVLSQANLTSLRSGTADFYALDGDTTESLGMLDDIWQNLAGLLEQGADTLPVLLLPRPPSAAAPAETEFTATLTARDLLWYGRLNSSVQATLITGTEGADELLRIGPVTVDEIR